MAMHDNEQTRRMINSMKEFANSLSLLGAALANFGLAINKTLKEADKEMIVALYADSNIRDLERALKYNISEENYETCAIIRDLINRNHFFGKNSFINFSEIKESISS